jgi:phage FluMu protein Com
VIDQQARPMAEQQQAQPSETLVIRCGRCGGGLARVHLTVGSYIEQRCHHTIRNKGGKRETCGWVTKVWPTR